ncbi:hypothetical protein G5B46_18160 [Caulobacter sp. 602-2]|uniref:Thioredoxin-like fold domain-containing protein n=1 Tax=Caulobacter sp. 602-2 TaxID=2710887 RepID=A0A6G4R0Z1_9CAUL|nr:hypothetical protein [Caulobacter sp. 602-2]NGM51540.1 hypothetical protein [Caulobacter sp. 602-2]
MKNWKLWAGLAAVVVVIGAGWWAWWNFELRWRPKTITRNQAEIAKILEGSGWVSPGLKGPKLYMISFRTCPDCVRFKKEEYPRLHKAGIDTRLIEIARADRNGVPKSTPVERATVAELWINRSWELSEKWDATPVDAWTAPGLKPADGDIARTAVIEAGRKSVEDLVPLLKQNGVNFAYPLLVWWTPDGQMKACACEKRETYRFVRKDLGL